MIGINLTFWDTNIFHFANLLQPPLSKFSLQFLRSSVPFVWAAGDVAEFPLPLAEGKRVSIGHWQMALKMGETAGKNIARALSGSSSSNEGLTAFESVPFFWTVQYGKSLRYAG